MSLIMMLCLIFAKVSCVLSITDSFGNTFMMQNDNLLDAVQFLKDFDREAADMCNRVASSEWKFTTNSSDYNRRRMKEQQSIAGKFECLSWKKAATFDINRIADNNVVRQLLKIYRQGKCGLGDEKYAELTNLLNAMKDAYNSAKVCPYRGGGSSLSVLPAARGLQDGKYCDFKLDPDLMRIMETSQNEPELRYTWETWREKTGPPLRNSYMRYLNLANQAARNQGFRDAGEQMRANYEDTDFFFVVQDLWARVLPLYKQLFTYVRKGLIHKYGVGVIRPDGPIPAHLLGNMWAQHWKNILKIIKPGPSETPDITGEMIRQGYTPLKMFQTAEEFFTSIGLPPMSPEFWRNSMLQKTNEVHSQCIASAWDFCNNIDFRIKQCTQVTVEDFINAHHEMSHIQYYMQYSSQPFVYREGPNPAFHEAIAHAVGLCIGGPVHLQRMGLLSSPIATSNGNSMINIEYLLKMALDKLPFMAFSLSLEKWRWYVFEKGPVGLNARWWDLRLRFQGVIPPGIRFSDHFDAGAKYHVVTDQDYIKYFVATILQFQIYSELCHAAGHSGPLHTCDFYRSREAGRILSEIMQYGASMSGPELLKILTRGKTTKMSAEPLLEFFKPLEIWLEQQNQNELKIGWNSNMDDVALFQQFSSSAKNACVCSNFCSLIVILTVIIQKYSNNIF